tara:strand:- start:5738 stop:7210 length:1473 start_codon:yes stop_codon:yes gene_type:complete
MRKYGDSSTSGRSGVDYVTWGELLTRVPSARFNHGHLGSDLEHRDPTDDLHNIEDGKYLAALDALPQHLQDMWMDTDVHVEFVETDAGHYQILKIVRKREPAFVQSKETFWGMTADGKRCPLTEEEFDKLTGGHENPDDVYHHEDTELVCVDSAFVAPMDPWDVVFDATVFWQHIQSLRRRKVELDEAGELLRGPREDWKTSDLLMERLKGLKGKESTYKSQLVAYVKSLERAYKMDVANIYDRKDSHGNTIPGAITTMIYSADWFPYPADKRVHTARARDIITRIRRSDFTKQQVGKMINRQVDRRPGIIQELKAKALRMPLGNKRATLLKRAQLIQGVLGKARFKRDDNIPQSDTRKVWEAWQRRQLEVHGHASSPPWEYRRFFSHKYRREIEALNLDKDDKKRAEATATRKLQDNMARLFGDRRHVSLPDAPNDMETNPPAWLPESLEGEFATEDDIAAIPAYLDDSPFSEEEEDWLEDNLLSGGVD